jgi:hypothetical protein
MTKSTSSEVIHQHIYYIHHEHQIIEQVTSVTQVSQIKPIGLYLFLYEFVEPTG